LHALSAQANLDLPEDVDKKLMRCTASKNTFQLDRTTLASGTHAGLPQVVPTALSPFPNAARDYSSDSTSRRNANDYWNEEEGFRHDIQRDRECPRKRRGWVV
jgi:hypothetical protein